MKYSPEAWERRKMQRKTRKLQLRELRQETPLYFSTETITTVITDSLIRALQTGNGGWTRDALLILGVQWPPPCGWRESILGKKITVVRGAMDEALRIAGKSFPV